MRLHSLPDRLDAVLLMMEPCRVLADIGTDHGLLTAVALNRGLAERAVATDVRDTPLLHARDTLEQQDLEHLVELRRGDGLAALGDAPVDAVVMAGMGADTMVSICNAGRARLASVTQLLVQPAKDPEVFRRWALENGWHLRGERMVEERGRFHVACAFARGDGPDPAYAMAGWSVDGLLLVGPMLLSSGDPVARRFYASQEARLARWADRAGAEQNRLHATWRAALGLS